MQSFWKNPLGALPLMLLLASFASSAFGAAGNVQFVIGDVKLTTRAGVTTALVKGADINEGDKVVTGAGASAQLKMVDGGFIAVRPNTSMTFDTYRYNGKEDGNENAVVSLLQGGFRTITGVIGRTHKQNYLIKTETATIGIRGTDHEPMVILAPAAGQAPIAPPGTYDKVNVGVAFIANDAGSVDIQRNQVGFAPVTKAAPVLLPRIPSFYKPTPAPGPQKAKEEDKEGGKGGSQQAAEATASSRDNAVADPSSSATTTSGAAPVTQAPAVVAPVVAVTATGASGATLNTTTQTTTTSTGVTVPVAQGVADVVGFSSTSVLRDEILWHTTQIAPGVVSSAATTYGVSDNFKENLFNNSSGTPATPLTTPSTTPVTLNGPTNNANFLFNASGNLTQVLDTPHVIYKLSDDVPGSTTQFATPTPLAHAKLSFGNGATSSESYYDPGTGVRFGRWTGGTVSVTDLATGTSYIESLLAPGGAPRSIQWLVAQTPSSLPTTGEFHYTRISDAAGAPSFATAPTDSYGNVGTVDGARLSADFTNMKVSAGLRITMPSGPAGSFGIQNLGARFDNAPISNGGFNVSSSLGQNPAGTDNLHISCFGAGCAPDITTATGTVSAYGGRFKGAFDSATGNAGTADGAYMRYGFVTLYDFFGVAPPAGRAVDDYIFGMVGFKQGPQIILPTSAAYPVAAPVAPVVVVAGYGYNTGGNPFTGGNSYWLPQPSANLVLDGAGNLRSVAEPANSIQGDNQSLALSGGTANPATPASVAIGSAATATDGNILLGWHSSSPSLTVTGIDFNGCFGTSGCANPARTVLGDGLSWVRGPMPFPFYLPGAISGYQPSTGIVVPGVATYNLGASILHDQNGATGTVNSASLVANFSRANVSFNLNATTTAGNWVVSANGIRLDQGGSFHANGGSISPPTISSGTTVTPTFTQDTMSLSFSGGGNTFGSIAGQLMGIGVGGAGVTYNLNNCISVTCPTASASGALAFGLSGTPYSTLTPYHLALFVPGMNSAGQIDTSENYRINGGLLSPFRTQIVNNFPVAIDGELPILVTTPSPCTVNCTHVSTLQVTYAVAGATSTTGMPLPSIGTATLLESGYDLYTGIRWGRYGNGTIGVNDRISGASLGTMDLTTRQLPFVISGNQSGPTVLPISGTFNYSFVGGTSPVDSNGAVGAALTAANASLSANFTAQTVDAKLSNLVVGGNTWGASATGIAIQNNIFQAERKLGATSGSLGVTSSLGTNTSGQLVGSFTGSTGNGVGMAYSLNHGGNTAGNPAAVTVSGVAVFKR